MAEGQTRTSKRLKEKYQVVQELKDWNNQTFTIFQPPTNLSSKVSVKDSKKRRSRSVTTDPNAHSDHDVCMQKKRGRSKLKGNTNLLECCSDEDRAARKRAKSLSRSQQRIDLLLFGRKKLTQSTISSVPSNTQSDEEISFPLINRSSQLQGEPEKGGVINQQRNSILNPALGEAQTVKSDVSSQLSKQRKPDIDVVNAPQGVLESFKDPTPEQTTTLTTTSFEADGVNAASKVNNTELESSKQTGAEEAVVLCNNTTQGSIKDGGSPSSDQNQAEVELATTEFKMEQILTQLGDKIDMWGKELKTEIQRVSTTNASTQDELHAVQEDNTKLRQDLNTVRNELEDCKKQIRSIVGVTMKQSREIKECNDYISNTKNYRTRNNLIIRGVKEVNDENLLQTANDFFKFKLKIDQAVGIQEVSRMNNTGRDRAVLVVLNNVADKKVIFSHTKNLKNITNYEGKPFHVDNQVAGEAAERGIRNRHLLAINRGLQGSDQLAMTVKKGILTVENEVYKKQVQVPDVIARVYPTRSSTFPVIKGSPYTVDGSTFVGYSTAVCTIHDVNAAYVHVLNEEPEARSVMCGFRIPGRPFHTLQDYCDDNEHGGGHTILRMLVRSEIVNRAMFVARIFQGEHIGKKRFKGIEQAVRSAITRGSYNEVTKSHQFPWNPKTWNEGERNTYGSTRGGRGGYFHPIPRNTFTPLWAVGDPNAELWNSENTSTAPNGHNWDAAATGTSQNWEADETEPMPSASEVARLNSAAIINSGPAKEFNTSEKVVEKGATGIQEIDGMTLLQSALPS